MELQSTGEYCKCGGNAGYLVVDGELVCQSCGGLSPSARLVDGQPIKVGDRPMRCPKCGTLIQEARPELKIGPRLEDKVAEPSDIKRIVPHGTRGISKRR